MIRYLIILLFLGLSGSSAFALPPEVIETMSALKPMLAMEMKSLDDNDKSRLIGFAVSEVLAMEGVFPNSTNYQISRSELFQILSDMPCDRGLVETSLRNFDYDRLGEEIKSRIGKELLKIVGELAIALTEEQETAKTLVTRLKPDYFVRHNFPYDFLAKKLSINTNAQYMREMFGIHGKLFLRHLSQSPHPKLIIGCGNRPQTLNFEVNTHGEDDSIDMSIHNNPSIVGQFGTANRFIPDNHYKVIWDEAPLPSIKADLWREIERILEPGGFFVTKFYPWIDRGEIPEDSKLKILAIADYRGACSPSNYSVKDPHYAFTWDQTARGFERTQSSFGSKNVPWWAEKLGRTMSTVIIGKPSWLGFYSRKITPGDFPHGIHFEEQTAISDTDSDTFCTIM